MMKNKFNFLTCKILLTIFIMKSTQSEKTNQTTLTSLIILKQLLMNWLYSLKRVTLISGTKELQEQQDIILTKKVLVEQTETSMVSVSDPY